MQALLSKAQQGLAGGAARPSLAPASRLPLGVHAPFTSGVPARARIVARSTLEATKPVPVMEQGEMVQFPGSAGVYAVYDKAGVLQYVGLSRKVGPGPCRLP